LQPDPKPDGNFATLDCLLALKSPAASQCQLSGPDAGAACGQLRLKDKGGVAG